MVSADRGGTDRGGTGRGGTGVPPVHEFKITRRNLPHWQLPGSIYFITWRCTDGTTLNSQERNLALKAAIHWDNVKWIVYIVVVMPDHVHLMAQPIDKSPGSTYDLSEIIHSVKSFSAHRISKFREFGGAVWQEERYDRIVRDDEEFLEIWEYIRTNPVKKNLVQDLENYEWLYEKR